MIQGVENRSTILLRYPLLYDFKIDASQVNFIRIVYISMQSYEALITTNWHMLESKVIYLKICKIQFL